MHRSVKALLFVSLFFFVSACKGPEVAPPGFSEAGLAKLDAGMQALVDKGDVAGLSLSISRHGKTEFSRVYGYRDREAGAPMTPDTIFRIYSMTKPVTGVAMMILYEEGKWKLDDPVSKFIPEFSDLKVMTSDGKLVEPARPMTIRQLMSHTGGLTYGLFGNTPVDKLYRTADLLNSKSTLQDMIQKMAKLPLDYQPGTQWKYSVSVDVQGYIVEKLSGQRLDEFFRTRIFEPLKMPDTGFFVPKEKLGRFAQLYTYDKAGKLVPSEISGVSAARIYAYAEESKLLSGGGGLVATTEDYMRFCRMLLNGGGLDGVRILKPETVALMASNHLQTETGGPKEITYFPGVAFGLDFAVVDDVEQAGWHFSKGTYFWSGAAGTWFWIDPKADMAVVGMIQVLAVPTATAQPSRKTPELIPLSRDLIYPALIDSAK
jgi:CubicO group peptidase (beta-lactamase class C family)